MDVRGLLRLAAVMSAASLDESDDDDDDGSSSESDADDDGATTVIFEEDEDGALVSATVLTPAFAAVPADEGLRSDTAALGAPPPPPGGTRGACGALLPPPDAASTHQQRLTVVLDLDATLGAFRSEPPLYRPHLAHLFQTLQRSDCEVVVWTAALEMYAAHRLASVSHCYVHHLIGRDYRWFDPTSPATHCKDLRLLRRDLSRTVIIENSPTVVRHQPDNAILVQNYSASNATAAARGDGDDKSLLEVAELLQQVAALVGKGHNVPDLLALCPSLVAADFDGVSTRVLRYAAPGVPREYGTPTE